MNSNDETSPTKIFFSMNKVFMFFISGSFALKLKIKNRNIRHFKFDKCHIKPDHNRTL
jgi:hypothetical protein